MRVGIDETDRPLAWLLCGNVFLCLASLAAPFSGVEENLELLDRQKTVAVFVNLFEISRPATEFLTRN